MPVETFGFIDSLDASNPPQTDGLVQGDDHLRGIKATLKAQFPSLTGAVSATQGELNQTHTGIYTAAAGSSGSPSFMFVDSATAFFKKATGYIGFNGTLRGKGAVALGSVHMFPKAPASFGTASVPGTVFEYLEANGALYLVADYPELAAFYTTSFGGDGVTTFGVPDQYTTGCFPRSRTASLAAGTKQSNQNKQHTHTFSATTGASGSHTHTATSSVTDPGHRHFVVANEGTGGGGSAPTASNQLGNAGFAGGDGSTNLSGVNSDATTARSSSSTTGISVSTTVNAGGDHTHTVSGTTDNDSGGTEARPEAIAYVFAVKS